MADREAFDDKGNLTFDAIVKPNENSRKIFYSEHRDIIPKVLKDDEKEHEEDAGENHKDDGDARGPIGPVKFEKEVAEEADPFGLDQFLTEVKGGRKPLYNIGSGGNMRAGGGSSTREGFEGSGMSHIGFKRGR
ncbi:SKI-interacting protein, SKIP [Artemisia annua]|uniref:SKI-interacting protein, SKIP n=1 Tax=Artemisia annua TaxID=35608 RepID=A0A2U1MMT9_ARTAN|nr:SKI-interacting protein, SKIP [Artemisia annua]